MKFSTIALSTISFALIAGAGWYVYQKVGPASSTPTAVSSASLGRGAASPPLPAVQVVNGETVVVISPDMQRASHIRVARLASVSYVPTRQAYATVIDPKPLFDLCGRMAAARADVKTLTVQFAASRTQYDRSRTLFSDDRNVSRKSLQSANTMMRADAAKLESAKATVNGLAAAVRAQFGDALECAAQKPASGLLHRLQDRQASLVRISLSASDGASPPERVAIDSTSGSAVTALRLSASPSADPLMPGDPWLYVTQQAVPAGTRTVANVPSSHGAVSTLIVPQRAVVWYGGQTWVYVRTASDRFTRRHVSSADQVGQGFAVKSGFRAGDQVVTQGAQLLLSEELKPQGVATVCKDPPECDD